MGKKWGILLRCAFQSNLLSGRTNLWNIPTVSVISPVDHSLYIWVSDHLLIKMHTQDHPSTKLDWKAVHAFMSLVFSLCMLCSCKCYQQTHDQRRKLPGDLWRWAKIGHQLAGSVEPLWNLTSHHQLPGQNTFLFCACVGTCIGEHSGKTRPLWLFFTVLHQVSSRDTSGNYRNNWCISMIISCKGSFLDTFLSNQCGMFTVRKKLNNHPSLPIHTLWHGHRHLSLFNPIFAGQYFRFLLDEFSLLQA